MRKPSIVGRIRRWAGRLLLVSVGLLMESILGMNPWVWAALAAACIILMIEWESLAWRTPLRLIKPALEYRRFKTDLTDAHATVRRVISGDGTQEDRYKAMEALIRVHHRIGDLQTEPMPAPSNDPEWLRKEWYPLLLDIAWQVENGGSRWYHTQRKLIREHKETITDGGESSK